MTGTKETASTRARQRIERRCIPAVISALASGQLSVTAATGFLRLSPRKQATELNRQLALAREREERHRLVAEAIRGYLDTHNGAPIDLIELTGIIRKTLA